MTNDLSSEYINNEYKKGKFVELKVKDLKEALNPLYKVVTKGDFQYFYIISKDKHLKILYNNTFFNYLATVDVLNQDNSKYLEDFFTLNAYQFIQILKSVPNNCERISFYKEKYNESTNLRYHLDNFMDTTINDYTVDREKIKNIISKFEKAESKEKKPFNSESFKTLLQVISSYKGDLEGYFYVKNKRVYYIHNDNDTYRQQHFVFVFNDIDLPDMLISTKHINFFYKICKNFDSNIFSSMCFENNKLLFILYKNALYITISNKIQLILHSIQKIPEDNAIFYEERVKISDSLLENEIVPLLNNPISINQSPKLVLERLKLYVMQNDFNKKHVIYLKIKGNLLFLCCENNCEEFSRDAETFLSELDGNIVNDNSNIFTKGMAIYSSNIKRILKTAIALEKKQLYTMFFNKNYTQICICGHKQRFIIYTDRPLYV